MGSIKKHLPTNLNIEVIYLHYLMIFYVYFVFNLPVNINKCPTVLFGPGGGPIHSVDEWVSTEELFKMLQICLLTAVDWCEIS